MTSYVTIPNTDIDAESPIDVDLMTALRDNPIAITEAATGAPTLVAETGASMVLLETQTAATSTSIDFVTDIDGTYDEYVVKIHECLPTSDGDSLRVKISKDTGSTWEAGVLYRYVEKRVTDGATEGITGNAGTSLFQVISNAGSTSGEGITGRVLAATRPRPSYRTIERKAKE